VPSNKTTVSYGLFTLSSYGQGHQTAGSGAGLFIISVHDSINTVVCKHIHR